MFSCLRRTAHSHRPSRESYQDKDILALTLVLGQAIQPGSRVPLGVLLLPSLECPPGLGQLPCHARFKSADQCFGFNLVINIPDIFEGQRLLVAFQNNAETRVTHKLRPHRLGHRLSPWCLYQNLPPSSGMEGQKNGTSPLPHQSISWPFELYRVGRAGKGWGGWQKVIEEKRKGRDGALLNQEPKEHHCPCSFLLKYWLALCCSIISLRLPPYFLSQGSSTSGLRLWMENKSHLYF